MIRAGAVDVDGLDALGLPRVALRVARPTGGRRPARVRHTLESHGARPPVPGAVGQLGPVAALVGVCGGMGRHRVLCQNSALLK